MFINICLILLFSFLSFFFFHQYHEFRHGMPHDFDPRYSFVYFIGSAIAALGSLFNMILK